MKILVCISVVPDTAVHLDLTEDKTRLNYDDIVLILNPYEEHILSKLLLMKGERDIEITVLNIGLDRNESVIRRCLAMGADNAIRIDKEATDSLDTAKEIANYISTNPYDIIFFGKESIDFKGNGVYGMVAGMLGMPLLVNVEELEIGSDFLRVVSVDSYHKAYYRARMPLLLSVKKEIIREEDLVIPNMRGIMAARLKNIEVIVPFYRENVISAGDYERVEKRKECIFIDPPEKLIEILRKEKLI